MSLATLALAEFRRRKASIDEAVAAHRFPRAQGEANLKLWLAIALTAGAAPRDCAAVIEHWQDECEYSDTVARMILLDDGPPREDWRAELARARDAAAGKARARPTDRIAQERSLTLQCLSIALGVPPEAAKDPPPLGGTEGLAMPELAARSADGEGPALPERKAA